MQDNVLKVSHLTDNDDFIWANKQERKNEAQGPGNIGIQTWEPKPEVIQSGSQKPNMGYSQCHKVRNTGLNDDRGFGLDAYILADYTLWPK